MAGLDWATKRAALLMLSEAYPAAYGPWLKSQDLKSLDEEGRGIYGDIKISEEVYRHAAIPLHMAELDEVKRVAKPIDEVKFGANFTAWFKMGEILINNRTDQFTGPNDPCVKKLTHFVELTICQNLGLTELRLKDREAIGRLCRTYLISPKEIKIDDVPGPGTPLLDRFFYLGVHVAKMITSLKPVSTIYNTGHLRIMDYEEARQFGPLFPDNPRNQRVLFRTSMNTPTTLAHQVYKIVRDEKTKAEGCVSKPTNIKPEGGSPVNQTFLVGLRVRGLKVPSTGFPLDLIANFYLTHQSLLEGELAKVAPQLAMMPLENNQQLAIALATAQVQHAKQAEAIDAAYSASGGPSAAEQAQKVREAASRLTEGAYSAGPGKPVTSVFSTGIASAAAGVGFFESKANVIDERNLEQIVQFLNEVHAPFGNQNWMIDRPTQQIFYNAPSAYYTDGKGHVGNQVSNELRQFTDRDAIAGFTQDTFKTIILDNLKPEAAGDERIFHFIREPKAINELLGLAKKWQERPRPVV